MPDFHNPYNFIPNADRSDLEGTPFFDYSPWGHSSFLTGTTRGLLRVKLTAATHLVISDASRSSTECLLHGNSCCPRNPKDCKLHETLPLREVAGTPHISPSAIKGMLRSVYETVTLSRYGIFTHDSPLEHRINRRPWKASNVNSPLDLATKQRMQPAVGIGLLSLADQVFGWVSQDGAGDDSTSAVRGKVSVGMVKNIGMKPSNDSRTLSILSTPRPSYGRFYTGPIGGGPWSDRLTSNEASYDADKARLRGRKVYPHQRSPAHGGAEAKKSNQNKTIVGMIGPGSSFTFDIRFEGLDSVELGALLWMIQPNETFHHKLGTAKPFGYGSVTLEIDEDATRIESAADARRSWLAEEPIPPELPDFVQEYKDALISATDIAAFESHPTIAAFLRYGAGLDGEARYPGANNGDGRGFEWFVKNEKGPRHSLPEIGGTLPDL